MNKKIILILLGLFASVAGLTPESARASGQLPITPAQVANLALVQRLTDAAVAALDAGNFVQAETDAREGLPLEPGSGGRPIHILASALAAQGKTAEALKDFSQAASETWLPQYALPYALLLLKSGHWGLALDAYNRTLPNVTPLLAEGHDLLDDDDDYSASTPDRADLEADIHIALGFTGVDDYGISGPNSRYRALAEYGEALKLEPDSPLANLAYARGLRELGKEADARSAYQDVVSKYSGNVKIAAEKELGIYRDPVPAVAPTNKSQ